MPCSHAGGGDGSRDRGVDRRDFLRSAVAIGGSSALAACLDREDADPPTGEDASSPTGTVSYTYPDRDLPGSQHEWGPSLVTDPHGNTMMPQHNVLLFLDYAGDGTPTQDERDRVESGFRTLERAYRWGTGDSFNAVINEGLLFMVSYSNSYFDRFDADLPVELPTGADVVDELGEDEHVADEYDAMVFLSSGLAQVVLGAEEALVGEREAVNGVAVEGGLDGVFTVAERRSGFVGQTHPHRKVDEVDDDVEIPETAPMFMGFKSAYTDSIPPEDRVTLDEGPFAGGTTQQVSQLAMDLEPWYALDHEERVHRMYSPDHDPEEVGEAGHDLASSSGMTREMAESLDEAADEHGVVGHGQKTAAARDEQFVPTVVRRDFDTTHDATPGLAFVGLQRRIEDFVETRRAMNADDVDVADERHGILDFIDVESRATFLVPPRRLRSLPVPRPSSDGE